VGHRGHAHGGTGVARVGLGGGINLGNGSVMIKLWRVCCSEAEFRCHWRGRLAS
jgi:hypothetical protein